MFLVGCIVKEIVRGHFVIIQHVPDNLFHADVGHRFEAFQMNSFTVLFSRKVALECSHLVVNSLVAVFETDDFRAGRRIPHLAS